MSEVNIFELASMGRYRYPYKGSISTEDLWLLPIGELDLIYKTLNSEAKKMQEDSLLDVKTNQNIELDVKIAIIKHIVEYKQAINKAKLEAKSKAEQKHKIDELIAKKKDSAMEGMSIEELEALKKSL